MKKVGELGVDEMRKALRDLQTWCYLEGDQWNVDREIGGTDTVDVVLGVLQDLQIAPNEKDDGQPADPVEFAAYL